MFTIIDGVVIALFDGHWLPIGGSRARCREAAGASRRFAASSLRCDPPGDPLPSTRRSAAMAASGAFGHWPIIRFCTEMGGDWRRASPVIVTINAQGFEWYPSLVTRLGGASRRRRPAPCSFRPQRDGSPLRGYPASGPQTRLVHAAATRTGQHRAAESPGYVRSSRMMPMTKFRMPKRNKGYTPFNLKVSSSRPLPTAACPRVTPSVPCRKSPCQRAFPKPSEKVVRGAPARLLR